MPDNDFMKEQKRRQRELIELKKLEQSGGELPNDIEHTVLTTPRQKFGHFWHYYKWYVIASVIIIAALAFLVAQCVTKTYYDSMILFNSTEFVAEDVADALEAELSRLVTDVNGDGESNLCVLNCTSGKGSGSADYNTAQATKFQAQVFEGKARIFLVNKEIFDRFDTAEFKLWSDAFALPEFDGKAINIKDTSLAPFLAGYKDDYYLCYRRSESYDTPDAEFFRRLLTEYQNKSDK